MRLALRAFPRRLSLKTFPRSSFSFKSYQQTCRYLSTQSSDQPIDVEAKEVKDVKPSLKDDDFPEFETKTKFSEKGETVEEKGQSPTGEKQTQSFKAETKQILDIVANSLYTDKEVFLRELISNASDALEKARYTQSLGHEITNPEKPLEIRIYTNEKTRTLVIQDYGVGMNRDELVTNIGTIARSGSKEFLQKLKKEGNTDVTSNIIGQFGVGFYSAFMVGDRVEIYSKTAIKGSEAPAQFWTSDGSGSYEISDAENVNRGTKIIIHLKESCAQFANSQTIEGIIRKYSNFVGFPIYLNDEKVNTVQALWTMDKKDITEEQHQEFYKLQGGYDTPQFRLQFKVDTPLNINVLLYFPSKHMERWEQRLEPSVNVYSRKVLIQAKSKHILPDWARFIKGVVDSEDIPLNISRETLQDSALINKIKGILVKKIVKFLDDESKRDPEKYMEWYSEFANFIKEGVINDPNSQLDIARLLRFETSLSTKSTTTAITPSTMNPEITPAPKYKQYSLDEYVSRMSLDQKGIYYLTAPNRDLALLSPYYEAFEKKGIEVIFIYHEMDPFLMRNLGEFNRRKLINLERADIEIPKDKDEKKPEPKTQELCDWIQRQLETKVSSVKVSNRLLSSPALIVDHEVAPIRKLYKQLDPSLTNSMFSKQKLEINVNHPLIEKLNRVRITQPQVAKLTMEQIYDNALLAADILDNPRQMIPRLNEILEKSLDQNLSSSSTSTSST